MARSFFMLRHGERCDFAVGDKSIFMRNAFDSDGNYTRFDLNLPEKLINRSDGWQSFATDTPLTVMGWYQSKLIGEAFKKKVISVDFVYSSPALRCVETALGFLDGLENLSAKVLVEPGLFQWTKWCTSGMPKWIPAEEYASLDKFYLAFLKGDVLQSCRGDQTATVLQNIEIFDPNHEQILPLDELKVGESLENYFKRSEKMVREITRRHPTGNILLVGHGGTLEVCSRRLCGEEMRPEGDYYNLLGHCTYLATLEMKQLESGEFVLGESPIPPMTVSRVPKFDPKVMTMSGEELAKLEEKTKQF